MTTAHKPTWAPAMGGESQGGNSMLVPTRQYSAKDLPGMLHMKVRHSGQGSTSEQSKINFKEQLKKRERDYRLKKFRKENPDATE